MASCCSPQASNKHICPQNNKPYLEVPYSTVLQHIKQPWKAQLAEQNYYFCDDPDCTVVYFGEDDSTITQSELRTVVAIKEKHNTDALVCYCFDITRAQAQNNSSLKQYVIEQTKSKLCSCESRNPSGRCCLKDFP